MNMELIQTFKKSYFLKMSNDKHLIAQVNSSQINIFENESNLLSTFPSKPIMIIFTNRKTKQTVNTPPKIPVRTLVILLLFIVIKNFVNNKSWSALCFHINLSDVFAYNTDCKELKSSDCPN